MLSSLTSSPEYRLAEAKCAYLSVVQYDEPVGRFVFGEEPLSDGHHPVVMCDNLDADLGYMMHHLTNCSEITLDESE